MKSILSTTVLLVCILVSNAQSYLSPIERLNGIIMEKQLFIKYDESTNTFLYYKDEHPGNVLQINQDDLFTIKGTDNGKYTLAIEFYNPLRVKFNFDEKRVADPAIEAINTFISKFPTEFVQFNMADNEKKLKLNTPETNIKPYEYPSFIFRDEASVLLPAKKDISTKDLRSINVNDYFSSYVISQWVYELNSALKGLININDSAEVVSLFKDISNVDEAERYLYGKINIGDESKTINDWVLDAQKKIYEVTSHSDFWNQLVKSKEVYTKLVQSKQKAESALNNFFNLITDKYDERIAPIFRNENKKENEAFKKYCKATVSLVNILILERKQAIDESIKKLNEFNEALQKFYNQFQTLSTSSGSTPFAKVLQTSQIRHDDGIIKNIYVSATKLDEDGKEHTDQAKTVNFNISRWNSMYPVVSTGSLFTNFSFPSYTIDSTNSLINISHKKIRATPAVYLNFYTNLLKNDYLYFFLQLGVAPINENGSILIPIGAGLSIGGTGTFANRITFSGGFLPALVKELNKLTVGDKVKDNSVLRDDLSYKLLSTGYFSININLFK